MIETTTAAYFSTTKIIGIVSGVCGSVIPILALADKVKLTFVSGVFMATTGTSFSIFVGPWVAEKIGATDVASVGALGWVMGALGVYIVRAAISWLEQRGVSAIDNVFSKFIGPTKSSEPNKSEDGGSK